MARISDSIADSIALVLEYMMTHVKVSVLLFLIFLSIIGFIAYMACRTKIFGFWWKLDNMLNRLANTGLLVATIGLIFEILIISMMIIWRV